MAVGATNDRLFPTLTEAQIRRVAAHRQRRQTTKGQVLAEIGGPGRFFVVVCGAMQVDSPAAGAATVIVTHSPRQFTDEANLITGRRAFDKPEG